MVLSVGVDDFEDDFADGLTCPLGEDGLIDGTAGGGVDSGGDGIAVHEDAENMQGIGIDGGSAGNGGSRQAEGDFFIAVATKGDRGGRIGIGLPEVAQGWAEGNLTEHSFRKGA